MSESKLPYFKFYPSDFMGSGKVQVMSPAERGIYISLLCHEWQEGPLPDDTARLARVSGASLEEMEEAWPAVRPCFEVDDDGRLYHPRLERERDEAVARSHMASRAAKKRWEDADADASADADAHADAHADGDADAMRTDMPLGDAIPRVSESQSTETQNSDTGVEKLLRYLPDGDGVENCIRAIAATSRGSPKTWALGFMGMWGPNGTRHRELTKVPEDERPTVLLDALQAYLAEGQPWDQRFFGGFLRNAIKRHLGGESPNFGDETERDAGRRRSYKKREGETTRKRAAEEIEKQNNELAELRSWYKDLPDTERARLKADIEERVRTMAAATRGSVPDAMRDAAALTVLKQARQEAHEAVEAA